MSNRDYYRIMNRLKALEDALPHTTHQGTAYEHLELYKLKICECGRAYGGSTATLLGAANFRCAPEEKCPECMPEVWKRRQAESWARANVEQAMECMKAQHPTTSGWSYVSTISTTKSSPPPRRKGKKVKK